MRAKNPMARNSQSEAAWIDCFLFVGNHLALDFLNTKPVLGRHESSCPMRQLSNGG